MPVSDEWSDGRETRIVGNGEHSSVTCRSDSFDKCFHDTGEKVGGGFYDNSNRAQRSLILEEDVAHLQAQGQLAVHFGHVNYHSVSASPTKT